MAIWVMHAANTSFDALESKVARQPDLAAAHRETQRRVLLDTFDWRLHAKGLTLELEPSGRGGLLRVRDADGDTLASESVASVPRFASDLPELVGARVAKALDVRALISRAEIDVERQTYGCLNRDAKTIARLTLERGRCADQELTPLVRLEAVRGYERAATRLVDQLVGELSLTSYAPSAATAEAFRAAGASPGDYSSKLDVELDPDRSAEAAMVRLFARLLATMDDNEPGVRDDTDSEFLHDFRVAIRRTRSLLPVAQTCFPDGALEPFLPAFRELALATSEARDLDVLLLDLPSLADDVAPEWRDDLARIEPFVAERRRRARVVLLRALDGPWPELRSRWLELLSAPPEPAPADAIDAGAFARSSVAAAHRGVLKAGRRVRKHSPGRDVHRLRKRAKVLRYQLEAFASLLPADDLAPATAELRKLQDVLGTFQDHDVQVQTVRDFAVRLHADGSIDTDVVLAMGALRANLRERREHARHLCARAFRAFDAPDNHRRYERLVAGEAGDA